MHTIIMAVPCPEFKLFNYSLTFFTCFCHASSFNGGIYSIPSQCAMHFVLKAQKGILMVSYRRYLVVINRMYVRYRLTIELVIFLRSRQIDGEGKISIFEEEMFKTGERMRPRGT